MMNREKVLEFLESQFEKLKEEEHVEDLMKRGRLDELNQLVEELDFSILDEFRNEKYLALGIDEIPVENYLYEIVFYVMHSDMQDCEFFLSYNDIIKLLRKKEEDLATEIAELMQWHNLKEYSIEELLNDE